MKKNYLLIILIYCLSSSNSKAQNGFVLLNEYLPWPNLSCGVPSEFVELYNFGPGPVDISGYIVTDAHHSITIPPYTILNAGKYFVISGVDISPVGCSNINFVTVADVNYTTCNCVSNPIPTSGNGWLTDGGAANDPIVLFDPNLTVVDAVVRGLPAEPSTVITTSTVGGVFASKTFNLDSIGIVYETIGESAGRGNSFSRLVDGDCLWDKDTHQSAGSTNNKDGKTSGSLTSVLSITNANSCNNNGSISIGFYGVADFSKIFPVQYILGRDKDSNGVFDFNDIYINGVDSFPPTLDITGLAPGSYSLAIQPKSGCNYQSHRFTILPCTFKILDLNTFYFSAKAQDKFVQLICASYKIEQIQKLEIERSKDGINFEKIQTFKIESPIPSFQQYEYYDKMPFSYISFYRIKIIYNNNTFAYSAVEKIMQFSWVNEPIIIFPNPVENILTINFTSNKKENLTIDVVQVDGKTIKSIKVSINLGHNEISINTKSLFKGVYFLKFYRTDGSVIVKRLYKE